MSCERVARARHIRPQSEPNPRLRAPPVFWRAPGAPGASGGRWGALSASWGAPWGGLSLGWGGRNFRFFNFRVRWPRNSIRGQTIMAKQTAPREAAVSPSSGRFQVVCGGGPDAPWCGVRPSVHWQMRGRPIQHRAGLPPAPLTAEKPPSYSPAAHRRPTHSRRPAYTTKLRGSQRITRKRTSCPRDGPQPSSAAACEAGRAVLGLTPRSSR